MSEHMPKSEPKKRNTTKANKATKQYEAERAFFLVYKYVLFLLTSFFLQTLCVCSAFLLWFLVAVFFAFFFLKRNVVDFRIWLGAVHTRYPQLSSGVLCFWNPESLCFVTLVQAFGTGTWWWYRWCSHRAAASSKSGPCWLFRSFQWLWFVCPWFHTMPRCRVAQNGWIFVWPESGGCPALNCVKSFREQSDVEGTSLYWQRVELFRFGLLLYFLYMVASAYAAGSKNMKNEECCSFVLTSFSWTPWCQFIVTDSLHHPTPSFAFGSTLEETFNL